MKKIVVWLCMAAMLVGVTGCRGNDDKKASWDWKNETKAPSTDDKKASWDWKNETKAPSTDVTLNVYNWGEYIDTETVNVNAAFTHLTGIKVNYRVFAENESMYAMLKAGDTDYDVVVPSDYMVGKMIKENMLAKLNFDNIPNFQYIDQALKNPNYDPTNEYSVPYTWGTVGIFYNSKYVEKEDLKLGWDLLWSEKYKGKIFMFNNPRDAFGIALNKLGYSMNTTNSAEWQAAYEELLKQHEVVQAYLMDQVYEKMIAEEGWIAPYYAGDGIIMMDKDEGNTDINYFVPESGTNRFVDALCITSGSKNKDAAEKYINFMCRTEVALANAECIGYATPQTEARKLLDPAIGENPNFYPPKELLDKSEVFLTLPQETNALMESLWGKVKK